MSQSCDGPPSYGTVEWLIETIRRATDEEHADWGWHDADMEYSIDMLNEWFPGLGDKVASVEHDYPEVPDH